MSHCGPDNLCRNAAVPPPPSCHRHHFLTARRLYGEVCTTPHCQSFNHSSWLEPQLWDFRFSFSFLVFKNLIVTVSRQSKSRKSLRTLSGLDRSVNQGGRSRRDDKDREIP